MKSADRGVKILLQKSSTEIMETLVLANKYKIVVPLFGGAAYAAPNIGTTIL